MSTLSFILATPKRVIPRTSPYMVILLVVDRLLPLTSPMSIELP
jgi:hypothetical protein